VKSPSLIERVWWRQRPWIEYGAKLVRYYSLRQYRLRYSPEVSAAGVSPELRTIWLNPHWPEVPPGSAIRCLMSGRDFHLAMIRGFIAHEAGHIRFSGLKPRGLLGDLWNALEDERIERLMVMDHPELVAPFTLLGDLFAASARRSFKGDALEGCLCWRWCWDQPSPMWRSADNRWEQVKPLVERAWEAGSSAEVVAIARAILALLELPEQAASDPRFEHLSADGGDGAGEADQGATGGGQPAPPTEQIDDRQQAEQANQGAADDDADQGATGGVEPVPPTDQIDAMQERAARILLDIDGHARDLAATLRPAMVSRLPRPHRSRGRFAYDRFKAGSERCYRLRPVEHDRPFEVRVCLDLSDSMGELTDPGSNLYAAVRTCALLVQACALANVPIAVYGFNFQVWTLAQKGTPSDETLLRLADLNACGTTRLGPALKRALEGADRNQVIVVICDGKLATSDAEVCSDLVRRTEANVLPLLIGSAASTEGFPGFERYLAVAELGDLPGLIRAGRPTQLPPGTARSRGSPLC